MVRNNVDKLRHGGQSICELIKKEFKEFKIVVIKSISESNIYDLNNINSDGFIICPSITFQNFVEIKNIFERSKYSYLIFGFFHLISKIIVKILIY